MDIQSIKQIKVKDICVSIGYWIIKVKVVQLWSEHDANNLGDVLSIEMVLMDSEGCTIQGSIPKDVLKSRLFDISKGGFYKIGRVVVIKNDGVQKETDHPNKLVFWTKSFVKRWEPQGLTSIGMINPFSAAQIRTYDNDLEHFIDIVGLCTSISSERAHLIDGKVVKMVLLELTDETGRIECVLYYQYVDLIHEFFRTNGISTPIVVVQFTRMMPFKPALFGDSVIQVVPNLTRFLFNRQMTE
ncbi:Nucleic acid-binding, OB-fold, partial [Sesbania bispinosa]